MTVKEKMRERLVECGMFDEEADEVLVRVREAKENEFMLADWNRQTDGYPDTFLVVLWVTVRKAALAWIDEHCPDARYRSMVECG